jgi:predicted  nucleic acid-binding Zn-ribbon protein
MKMKKYFLVLVALIFTFNVGCSELTQMEKVMAIHDEVMPKMGKIGSLVAQLRKKIDNDQGGAAEKKAMEDLQDANKSMMDWMQDFGKRFDSDEIINGKALTDEKKKWLNEEEEKVKLVKEKINTSIANAEALLGQ